MENNDKDLELNPRDIPTLILEETPVATAEDAPAVTLEQSMDLPAVAEPKFTPAEQQVIDEFAEKIDITNVNMVLQYGSGAQKHIALFSESTLDKVRTKDMGKIGDNLSNLVVELKTFNALEEEKKGIAGWFKKQKDNRLRMKAGFETAEVNVNKISEMLETHQVTLLKDIAMFGKMYDMNLNYFKELSMYIAAGKKKLAEVNAHDLPALKKKAQESGLPEDAQAYNDRSNMAHRFEKRLHDLDLTRVISLQMGPQIRLIQNNDSLMVEKIHSSIVNTIPLWKSQMVMALGLENSRRAVEAQKQVADMTNELLRENAELLKTSTIGTARESERGIVEIQTLVETNNKLIMTIDEVVKIQAEGRAKRQQAEQQLLIIEGELKTKLLEISSRDKTV